MSDRSLPTAVVQLHPVADGSLQAWLERATAAARSMAGFTSLRLAVSTGGLQPAVAATFDTAEHLHAWLDSGAMSAPNTEGVLRKSSDLLIIEGQRLPPGTAVFRHDVIEGQSDGFIATQHELTASTARFSGCMGTVVIPPDPAAGIHQWMSILCFRTDGQLAGWSDSEERIRGLETLRSHLTLDFDTMTVDAPFGSILRFEHGRPTLTPKYKTAMLVLLVLYPMVMTLSRFLDPVFAGLGAQPWLTMWLSEVVSVTALTYLLMPTATRLFARWLDPIDGSSVRVSSVGALVVVSAYAATLWLFGAVEWLHFWGR